MKNPHILLLVTVLVCALTACSTPQPEISQPPATVTDSASTSESGETPTETTQVTDPEAAAEGYTKYADYEPAQAVPAELIQGTNPSVLVAYFSRSGNTQIPADTDALTSPSLVVNADGTTLGNTEQVAQRIAEETGGDLFLIQTEYTYPLDAQDTVAVGEGQDIDAYRPSLAAHLENMDQYDTVYLVYPIWHYTLPAPVSSFLDEYDLGGKTIYAFSTHSGSRFADTISKIQQAEPGATVVEGMAVSGNDVANTLQAISEKVHELAPDTGSSETTPADMEENNIMNVQIGDYTFAANLSDTEAARELAALLAQGPISITMRDYSGFEKVGALPQALTASDSQITTQPGDIMLYNADNIVMFYGSNTWAYTPLARINDLTDWATALSDADVTVTFSIS